MKNSLWVLFFLCAGSLFAQGVDSKTITWAECVQSAEQLSPEILALKEKVVQADSEYTSARSKVLPHLDATAGVSKSKTSIEGSPDQNATGYSVGANADQLIYSSDIFLLPQYSAKQESARYALVAGLAQKRYELRNAFIESVKARQLTSVCGEMTKRRLKNVKLVETRYIAGRENKGSFLEAKASYQQAVYDEESARRAEEIAGKKLAQMIGFDSGAVVFAREDLLTTMPETVPDYDSLVRTVPSVKSAEADCRALRYAVTAAKSGHLPQVSASASVARDKTIGDPAQTRITVGANMSIPIFSGFETSANVDKTESALREGELSLKNTRGSVRVSLEASWNSYTDAVKSLAVQKDFLDAGEERARIAESQYAMGLVTFDTWSTIEDNLANIRKKYIESLANASVAEAAWIETQGGTFDYDRKN